ncbi:hypothetical protein VPH35_074644 [Triticum aestivum]
MEAPGSSPEARPALALRAAAMAMEERELVRRGAVAVIVGFQSEPEPSEVARAFAVRFGVEEGAVEASVLVTFRDASTRNEAMGLQGPLLLGRASFMLSPWTRLRRARAERLCHKVRVCLEGVPRRAWQAGTVAGLFGPSAIVERRDDSAHSAKDAACMRVWVWMDDFEKLPLTGQLSIEEPRPREGRLTMRTYDVLLHLDCLMDYTGGPPVAGG